MLGIDSKYLLPKGWGPSSVTAAVIKEGRCDGTAEDKRLGTCLGEESHGGGRFSEIALVNERGVGKGQ